MQAGIETCADFVKEVTTDCYLPFAISLLLSLSTEQLNILIQTQEDEDKEEPMFIAEKFEATLDSL